MYQWTRNLVDRVWNVMAHAQKPDFFFRRNGRVHLNRQGRQFSQLLASEVCASAVVMLDTPCSEVVWRVLATHSICQFPLQLPFRAPPCAITFQLDSDMCMLLVSKYLTTDNTTIAGISKENNTNVNRIPWYRRVVLCGSVVLSFRKYWPDDGLFRTKLSSKRLK
jgi:hypothetical protein